MKIEKLFSVGTTFNKRLYEDEHQEIVKSMMNFYPNMDFYVYHENLFEQEKYNEQLVIKEKWDNLHIFDLFEENNWLSDFLKKSPFKDVHKYGTPSTFDPPYYWIRNSIFWFRKVVAINNCKNICKTPFLIWVGCDTKFNKSLDEIFIDYVKKYDICHIDRSSHGLYTETDTIVFNLQKNAKTFIVEYIDYYLDGKIFSNDRWDDCIAFDKTKELVLQKYPYITFGSLSNETGAPFHVYDYLFHWRNPLFLIRDIKQGI